YIFFNELKENERSKMELLAAAYAQFFRDDNLDSNVAELTLEIIQSDNNTPRIMYNYSTNDYDLINLPKEYENDPVKIEALIEKFKTQYEPIDVTYGEDVFATIYYGNSEIINKLKYYPAAIIIIILLFVGVVYFFFRTRKAAEQNRLWAGMAKETAHQIGTPLSSLIGWTEILKSEKVNPEYIVEMEKDIDRLQTITERFSKIGSLPTLEMCDIITETINSFDYLKARSSNL